MNERALVLWSLNRVHARDLIIVVLVGVVLHALLVELDCLSEQLEALVCVALVLALVEVCGRVALQLLLDSDEVLLRMGSDLGSGSRLHKFLHSLPVLAEVLEGYKCKAWLNRGNLAGIWKDLRANLDCLRYLPCTNFLCSSLVHLPAVLPIICAYVTFLFFCAESF